MRWEIIRSTNSIVEISRRDSKVTECSNIPWVNVQVIICYLGQLESTRNNNADIPSSPSPDATGIAFSETKNLA